MLVQQHPLRERLRAQLMLALYRSGRQAEALEAFRGARSALMDELGLEPSPALHRLQRAILAHDPALDVEAAAPRRSILVVPAGRSRLDALVAIAEPLARQPPREIIVAWVVERNALADASERLSRLGVRAAAFASTRPGRDVVRLAAEQDVDLLLLEGGLTPDTEIVLESAPCDVALMPEPREVEPIGGKRAVLVPFTGAEHDWAAVELAAWIARAHGAPLRLAGSAAGPDGRDASRLLASASLIVQRVVGITTAPLLVEPGPEGIVQAAEDAGLVVFGLPVGWRTRGLGEVRAAIARHAKPPTLFVRKGLRPGGLAPQWSRTRFSWSLRR
jgi:hypothetical protein